MHLENKIHNILVYQKLEEILIQNFSLYNVNNFLHLQNKNQKILWWGHCLHLQHLHQ